MLRRGSFAEEVEYFFLKDREICSETQRGELRKLSFFLHLFKHFPGAGLGSRDLKEQASKQKRESDKGAAVSMSFGSALFEPS